MSELFAIAGAFLLYSLLLPLFGVLVGLVVRIVFPYSLGALIGYLLIDALFGWSGSQWLFILMSFTWVLAVLHSRLQLKQLQRNLAWYEGHYFGAINTLTLSQPLRMKRAAGS